MIKRQRNRIRRHRQMRISRGKCGSWKGVTWRNGRERKETEIGDKGRGEGGGRG